MDRFFFRQALYWFRSQRPEYKETLFSALPDDDRYVVLFSASELKRRLVSVDKAGSGWVFSVKNADFEAIGSVGCVVGSLVLHMSCGCDPHECRRHHVWWGAFVPLRGQVGN
jgi:hypothetical protein